MKLIKSEKNYLEFEIDNLTVCEVLRKYLWKNKSTVIAGWKREHPSKPLLFILKTKGDAKKILKESIEEIRSDLKKIKDDLKKIK